MRGLHPAWSVAAVTFGVLLVAAGIRSAPGVLIVPLEAEFGWSRATTGFAVAVNIVRIGDNPDASAFDDIAARTGGTVEAVPTSDSPDLIDRLGKLLY